MLCCCWYGEGRKEEKREEGGGSDHVCDRESVLSVGCVGFRRLAKRSWVIMKIVEIVKS